MADLAFADKRIQANRQHHHTTYRCERNVRETECTEPWRGDPADAHQGEHVDEHMTAAPG